MSAISLSRLPHSLLACAAALGLLATPSFAQSGPFEDLGGASSGVSAGPVQAAFGSLYEGTTVTFRIQSAPANAPTWCIIGLAGYSTPAYGGTFVPTSDWVVPLQTDAAGEAEFSVAVPATIGMGTDLYVQWLTSDASSPELYTLSNAIHGVTPSAPIDGTDLYAGTAAAFAALQGQGVLDEAMIQFVLDNGPALEADPALLLDILTPYEMSAQLAATIDGDAPQGTKWIFKNIFGFEIGSAQVQATCSQGAIGGATVVGYGPLVSSAANQIGNVDVKDCPNGLGHYECAHYQGVVEQKIGIKGFSVTLTSFKLPLDYLCCSCPSA